MPDFPVMPPIYRTETCRGEARAHTLVLAEGGADPATLVWANGNKDNLEVAIVLVPDQRLTDARQIVFVGALGLSDALASILPPGLDQDFVWPGGVRVNGRLCGKVSLSGPVGLKENDIPDWLVLSVWLRVHGTPDQNIFADQNAETTLDFEDCGKIEVADCLAAFSRHFLTWANRWQDDGFAVIKAVWDYHGYRADPSVTLHLADGVVSGRFRSLAVDGALVVSDGGRIKTIKLSRGTEI